MSQETSLGGPAGAMPETHRSAVRGLGSSDPGERRRSLDAVAAAYWKPVYKYIRLRWRKSNDDAKDLTQSFFERVVEKGLLDAYEAGRARFRTWLRTCLEGFLCNAEEAAHALKRGGGARTLSLDADEADRELAAASPGTPDADAFDREWVRRLVELAVDDLRARSPRDFVLFERHDLADGPRPTYAQLAADLGMSVTDVTNRLAAARRDFRRLLLERLRSLTANDEEFDAEAALLLGVRGP